MAGKVVGDFEPAEAFFVENVEGGWERLWVVERADVEVDFSGETVRLVGERSAAGRAKPRSTPSEEANTVRSPFTKVTEAAVAPTNIVTGAPVLRRQVVQWQ